MVFECPDDIQCVASPAIVSEWESLPAKASVRDYFERRQVDIQRLVGVIADLVYATRLVEPEGDAPPCRDENDRKYLHACVAGGIDFLVSTDLDLLAVAQVGTTHIVRPGNSGGCSLPGDKRSVLRPFFFPAATRTCSGGSMRGVGRVQHAPPAR